MNFKNSLKRAISAERDKLTDKEVFLSSAFKDFAESLLRGVGKIYNMPKFKINVFWGDEKGIVACVDENCEFTLNANNVYLQGLDRKHRFPALIGCLCHEVSHRLWTDFKETNRIVNQIKVGTIQSYEARALNAYLQKFPEQRGQVKGLFLRVSNIIEDGAIERTFNNTYMGYRKYLTAMRQLASAMERETIESNGSSGDTVIDFLNLLLAYAVNGFEPDNFDNIEATEALEYLKPTINASLIEQSSKKRCYYCVTIVSELINFLQEKEEEKKNQNKNDSSNNDDSSSNDNSSSSDSSGSNDPANENDSSDKEQNSSSNQGDADDTDSDNGKGSDEANDSASDESADGSDGESENSDASNNNLNLSDDLSGEEGDSSNANYSPLDDNSDSSSSSSSNSTQQQAPSNDVINHGDCSNELSDVENNVAQEKVEQKQEEELQKQCNTLKNDMDFSDFHRGVRSTITRITDTSKCRDFDEINKECDTILKRLIKEWVKQIHDLQIGDNLNGLYSGRRLKQAYRTDLKRFSSKKAPENIPDMSICLLIDMSGSMNGPSIEAARKSAMLIYKFCKELDIRFCCYGHQKSGTVRLSSFAEFDSIDGKDLYRIANIEKYVGGCNRDGYALRYCAEKLSKEQAAEKILIIISDGAPNDGNYGFWHIKDKPSNYEMSDSGNAKLDIVEIEKNCAKQGISIITAGIGNDADEIKDLYEYGVSKKVAPQFLEITDLSKMPKRFVEILKKEIDKQR